MKANYLLIVIAGIEVVTGLALLLSPSLPISLLEVDPDRGTAGAVS